MIKIARMAVLVVLCCLGFFPAAQATNLVTGTLLDTTNVPLVGATVMLSRQPAGSLAGFTTSDVDGHFAIAVDSLGSYELKVTYVGYGTFARVVELAETGEFDVGVVVLNPNPATLKTFSVEAQFRPIVIRNDTIEYDADSFHAGENATVEDLLKRLPGVTVEADGTVKAQGEEVKKILVDGKEFFDNDPTVATRNIPADVVDKVQVFDDASDFSKFTGIKDGEDEKTINLAIKEGKNKGTFGEGKAAYGTDNRYTAGGSINRFNKKMQLSALGNANNISEQPFSFQDYMQWSGGMDDLMSGEGVDVSDMPMNLLQDNGITKSRAGGVNFNYDWNKKTALRSNYFYNRSDNETATSATVGNLINGGSYTTLSSSEESNALASHRLKFSLKHQLTDRSDLKLNFDGNLTDSEVGSLGQSVSSVEDTTVNRSAIESSNSASSSKWDSDFMFRHKLKKEGRFFTTQLKLNSSLRNGDGNLLNEREFLSATPVIFDTLLQQNRTATNELGYSAHVNYVEPLGKAYFLNFSARHERSGLNNERLVFDGPPISDRDPNPLLSNRFDRDLGRTTAGAKLQGATKKLVAAAGLEAQLSELQNVNLFSDETLRTDFRNVLPNAMLMWKRSNFSRLQVRYTTRVQVPTIQQLQPVIDNSDPLNIYQGNPRLSPEYAHSLNAQFSNLNEFYFRSLFAGVRGRLITDAIAESETVSPELVSTRTPVNSKTEWQFSAFYDYSAPVRKQNFKLRFDGEAETQQTNVLINGLADRMTFNRIWQTVRIENKKKKALDWNLGMRLRAQTIEFSESDVSNQQFVNWSALGEAKTTVRKKWKAELKGEYREYLPSDFVTRRQFVFLHGKISRGFLDNSLQIYVRGINLLDEKTRVEQSGFGNQYSEQITNRLGRVVLFGVSYKLRSFGK